MTLCPFVSRMKEESAGRLFPYFATSIVVVTTFLCFVLTKATSTYVGGLFWPYFSDIGRDVPMYYIVSVGLTLSAILLALSWIIYYRRVKGIIETTPDAEGLKCKNKLAATFGALSTLGMPTLAILDTANFPSIHNMAAYYFVAFQIPAVYLNVSTECASCGTQG